MRWSEQLAAEPGISLRDPVDLPLNIQAFPKTNLETRTMIWFDASLENPADDGLLQRCIAAMLNLSSESVDVVHSISEIKDALATCVVEAHSADSYSQLVTLYISEALPHPDVSEAAARLARTLDRSLLLANDATANPYSFIRVSNTGQHSVVLVDPDELDENGRYVIRELGGEDDEVSTWQGE